ncbi:MAG TPA: excalibur calcium-binding domain-containing protein [Mycobacteriales bacterium]|jgi:hypothetical protein|nr:excalibur calcium-binding domain-containing protein [Mycobacteriales bacterium]
MRPTLTAAGLLAAAALLAGCSATNTATDAADERPATSAPAAATTTPAPRPTTAKPSPRPSPTPVRTTAAPQPLVRRTTQAPKPAPPSATRRTTAPPATDPRFDTCKEAKAHGYGPYYRGQDPEYDWYRDADSDGIVCE